MNAERTHEPAAPGLKREYPPEVERVGGTWPRDDVMSRIRSWKRRQRLAVVDQSSRIAEKIGGVIEQLDCGVHVPVRERFPREVLS